MCDGVLLGIHHCKLNPYGIFIIYLRFVTDIVSLRDNAHIDYQKKEVVISNSSSIDC